MKNIQTFLNINLLYYIGFFMYSSFSQNLLSIRFGFDVKDIGYYFAYTGLLMTIVQIFIVSKINKRFSPKKILDFSLPILSLFLIIYAGFIFNLSFLLIFIIFFIIVISLLMVNMNLVLILNTGENERGKVLGIYSSVQSLAQVIAPIIGGVSSSLISYTSPFYLGAMFITFAAILS